jgi:hypothetical protein
MIALQPSHRSSGSGCASAKPVDGGINSDVFLQEGTVSNTSEQLYILRLKERSCAIANMHAFIATIAWWILLGSAYSAPREQSCSSRLHPNMHTCRCLTRSLFLQPVELGWVEISLEVASVLPQINALNWIARHLTTFLLVAMRSHLDKTSDARSRTPKKTRHWVKAHGHIAAVSQVPKYPLIPAAVNSCTDAGCAQLACVWMCGDVTIDLLRPVYYIHLK